MVPMARKRHHTSRPMYDRYSTTGSRPVSLQGVGVGSGSEGERSGGADDRQFVVSMTAPGAGAGMRAGWCGRAGQAPHLPGAWQAHIAATSTLPTLYSPLPTLPQKLSPHLCSVLTRKPME